MSTAGRTGGVLRAPGVVLPLLALVPLALAACEVPRGEAEAEILSGSGSDVPVEIDGALGEVSVLAADELVVRRGSVGAGQSVGALAKYELTGEQDRWSAYVDFSPRARVELRYPVPASVGQPQSLAVRVNYRGYPATTMRWTFELWDHAAQAWVLVGDNASAQDWLWTRFKLAVPAPASRFVANGRVRLRFGTESDFENAFVDELVVLAAAGTSAPADGGSPGGGGSADGGSSPPPPGPGPLPPADGGSPAPSTGKMFGVTLDAVEPVSDVVAALAAHARRPTARIVFDEFVPATSYASAVGQIGKVSDVLGELLDSFYVKQYSVEAYLARTREYLDALGSNVAIWEVGNEINGEWLGATPDVVQKMSGAYDLVKVRGYKTELTLYYNKNCWERADHEMFTWVTANVPERMKQGLDYVLVSYYEDDCNGYQPNWQQVMDDVGRLFPNAKIGIGECGTTRSASKATYLDRYYNLKVDHPRFVGGYFWWYYKQDMVPKTKALWSTLENIVSKW